MLDFPGTNDRQPQPNIRHQSQNTLDQIWAVELLPAELLHCRCWEYLSCSPRTSDRAVAQTRPAAQKKAFSSVSNPLKRGREAINLNPPRRVRACGYGLLRLEEYASLGSMTRMLSFPGTRVWQSRLITVAMDTTLSTEACRSGFSEEILLSVVKLLFPVVKLLCCWKIKEREERRCRRVLIWRF